MCESTYHGYRCTMRGPHDVCAEYRDGVLIAAWRDWELPQQADSTSPRSLWCLLRLHSWCPHITWPAGRHCNCRCGHSYGGDATEE